VLEHGGRVVTLEFHPTLMIFDENLQPRQPYFKSAGPYRWDDGVSDYVALSGKPLTPSGWLDGEREFKNPHPVHEFPWALSELVDAVLGAGLRLDVMREWPYANGFRPFREMRELPGGRYAAPEGLPELPLMLGLVAARP
jgi:hypothetical protein